MALDVRDRYVKAPDCEWEVLWLVSHRPLFITCIRNKDRGFQREMLSHRYMSTALHPTRFFIQTPGV